MESVYSGPTEPPEPREDPQEDPRDPDREPHVLPASDQLRQYAADAWDMHHWNPTGTGLAEGVHRCPRCGGPATEQEDEVLTEDRPVVVTAAQCPVCSFWWQVP